MWQRRKSNDNSRPSLPGGKKGATAPELAAAVRPLLEARKAFEQEADDLDRKVHNRARHDARKFITVLGLGPITVLCFKVTIDDPARFRRSRSVGAYVGVTNLRHASGEMDWTGRISRAALARETSSSRL